MPRHHSVVVPRARVWRSAARVLTCASLVAGAALVLPVGSSTPAYAGCETRSVDQMRTEADATAIGTIVEIQRPRAPFGLGTPQGATYWFEVSQVHDGVVHELIEVESSQGYELDRPAEGRSYLLFLRGESPAFSTDGCSSMPMPLTVAEAAVAVADWAWTAPQSGGAQLPSHRPPWPTIGLGALVLAMVVALVSDRRRRTRVGQPGYGRADTTAVTGIDP